jgi:hypothetical protein
MSADLIVVVEVVPGVEGKNNVYMVNYSKGTIKEWLVKTTVWAVLNGHKLVFRAPTQQDLDSRWLFKPRSGGDDSAPEQGT